MRAKFALVPAPHAKKQHALEGGEGRLSAPVIETPKIRKGNSRNDSHRPGRMVVRGLGRDRLSRAQAARLPRGRLSRGIFRHHRNQYVVLSSAAPRALPPVDRARLRPIRDSCSRQSSGRNSRTSPDADAEDERAVRAGFDVLRDAGKLGAVLLQFPFSFHRTPENTALSEETPETVRRLSAGGRGAPRHVERESFLRDAARARRRILQHRSAGHRPVHETQRALHGARRLRPAPRPPLRFVVQRRSRDASLGALQLSLHRKGTRTLGRAHPASCPKVAIPLSSSPTITFKERASSTRSNSFTCSRRKSKSPRTATPALSRVGTHCVRTARGAVTLSDLAVG